MRVTPLVAAFLALVLAAPLSAQPDAKPRAPSDYRQTDAVLTHYPALGHVQLASPAFGKPEPSLTSQDEMATFLATLACEIAARAPEKPRSIDLEPRHPADLRHQEGLDDPSPSAGSAAR